MDKYNILTLVVRTDNFSNTERIWLLNKFNELGNDYLLDFFLKKKVLPFGAKTCCSLDFNRDFWETILVDYRNRNNNILRFINAAYSSIHNEGARRVFVSENFGSLLSADLDIALFTSCDVDNFGLYEEYPKIKKALCDNLGCEVKEVYYGNNHLASKFYAPKSFNLPENFYFGLDFYPLARKGLPCFIDADIFVDWSGCYTYKDTQITLPSRDVLAYICMMHTSLHRFCQSPDIRLYFDLLCIEHIGYDENNLMQWSSYFNTNCRMAVATYISNVLLHTSFSNRLTYNKRAKGVLVRVLNDSRTELLYNPSNLKVLLIEICCNDKSNLHGIFDVIFPKKEWIKRTYGGTLVSSYAKHIIKLFYTKS